MILPLLAVLGNGPDARQSQAVDPFYSALLEKAQKTFLAKKYDEAARDFEVAAFGLVGNKNLRARALVYLGLCRYYLKDIGSSEKRLREAADLMGNEGFNPLEIYESAKPDLEKLLSFYGIPIRPAEAAAEEAGKSNATGPPAPPPSPNVSTNAAEKKPKTDPTATQSVKTLDDIKEGDLVSLEMVDTPPSVLKRINPVYPATAKRMKIEGTVTVNALISENGDVIKTEIIKGVKGAFGFSQESQRAVSQWKFNPASIKGIRVKVWLPVAIEFKL
jgi:TonB family protein